MKSGDPGDISGVKGKRVAIVSSVHRWNDTRIFIKQATSLSANGYDVVLVGIGKRQTPFLSGGVLVYPLPRRARHLRWMNWIAILRIIVSERPRVIHIHDPELFPLVLLLRITGCKAVCDVHEDFSKQILDKEWIPSIFRTGLSRAVESVEKFLPRLADAVILAEDSYARNFPRIANVTVVRNFPVLPPENKKDYHSDVFRMTYVGDVRKVRGIAEYVAISAQLVRRGIPTELWVIGSFANPSEEQEIRGMIETLGMEKRVRLFGRRPPEELPALLEQCDVGLALLHPIGNYQESYPTKMFEYMAAGLPVIASRFALWERVLVGNDCGCVVDPLNPDEATRAALEYWNSPDLRERHGQNGRRAVEESYHWDVDLRRLLDLYATLV